MEFISIVKIQNGEKIYLQNGMRTSNLSVRIRIQGVTVPYKLGDIIVLTVARITRQPIARVYVMWRALTRFTIRSARKVKGTSDKSPR